jgi:hypothetical protein
MGSIWSGSVSFLEPLVLALARFYSGEDANGMIIVIVLIAAEIVVAAINIVVDLYAGVD